MQEIYVSAADTRRRRDVAVQVRDLNVDLDDVTMGDNMLRRDELPIVCTLEVADGATRLARWRALSGAASERGSQSCRG